MRRRLIFAAGASVAVLVLVACGANGKGDGSSAPTSGLATKTVRAGEVDVKIEPTQLGDEGATFKIVLDTHSVELSMDLAASAKLEVAGKQWKVVGWTGDGPSGHHREGELRFAPSGPAEGAARLTLSGFPELVEASWVLAAA